MSFQVKEPVLVIGLGGVGSKLAINAKDSINSDCLLISNDAKDFATESNSIHISTDSVINPSVQLIRGSTYKVSEEIKSKIAKYSTVVLMSNMAGKATVEYFAIFDLISSDALYVEPLINCTDGLITESVEI